MSNSTATAPGQFPIRNENVKYRTKVLRVAQFELNSIIGRTFFNKTPKRGGEEVMLNLGGGSRPSHSKDWVNADFYPATVSRFLFSNLRSRNRADWELDLRFPLNCEDETWSGVFSSHTFEHLHYDQAFRLLKEIHRTLKPRSWVRLIVPDLTKYIEYYTRSCARPGFEQFKYGAEAIHNLTQNYLHLSVWDFEILRDMLQAAGFKNISQVSHRSGSDPRLLLDLDVREWESLYVEGQKEGR